MTEQEERECYEAAQRELAQARNLIGVPHTTQAHALMASAYLQMAEYIRVKRALS